MNPEDPSPEASDHHVAPADLDFSACYKVACKAREAVMGFSEITKGEVDTDLSWDEANFSVLPLAKTVRSLIHTCLVLNKLRVESIRREQALATKLRTSAAQLEQKTQDLDDLRRKFSAVTKLSEDKGKGPASPTSAGSQHRQPGVDPELAESLQRELDLLRQKCTELSHENDEAVNEIANLRFRLAEIVSASAQPSQPPPETSGLRIGVENSGVVGELVEEGDESSSGGSVEEAAGENGLELPLSPANRRHHHEEHHHHDVAANLDQEFEEEEREVEYGSEAEGGDGDQSPRGEDVPHSSLSLSQLMSPARDSREETEEEENMSPRKQSQNPNLSSLDELPKDENGDIPTHVLLAHLMASRQQAFEQEQQGEGEHFPDLEIHDAVPSSPGPRSPSHLNFAKAAIREMKLSSPTSLSNSRLAGTAANDSLLNSLRVSLGSSLPLNAFAVRKDGKTEADIVTERVLKSLQRPPTAAEIAQQVDQMVAILISEFRTRGVALPLKKLRHEPCKYQLGAKKLWLGVIGGRLVVRAGGGHQDLLTFLDRTTIKF